MGRGGVQLPDADRASERGMTAVDFAPLPAALGLETGSVVAVPANGETLWRITVGPEPTKADFLSVAALGDPNRGPAILTLGLSVFASRQQAEQIRDRFRRGQHVSAVSLPANRGFSIARTGRTPGHHTVWGTPDDLLSVTLGAADNL
jgi:hypothetical protein